MKTPPLMFNGDLKECQLDLVRKNMNIRKKEIERSERRNETTLTK